MLSSNTNDPMVFIEGNNVYEKKAKIFKKIRYFIIKLLAGHSPIMMNFIIYRPPDYAGKIVHFGKNQPVGIFHGNILIASQDSFFYEKKYHFESIITPRKGYK